MAIASCLHFRRQLEQSLLSSLCVRFMGTPLPLNLDYPAEGVWQVTGLYAGEGIV